MKGIKCKYCGRIYDSPSIMRTKKCHSHPKGAWCGYCTPNPLDEGSWRAQRFFDAQLRRIEEDEQRREKEKREEASFLYEYKQHTPLLDCVLGKDLVDDEPCGRKLQIRNSDLHQLAIDMANGINKGSKDAINTIYALRDGCDYVLNNAEAQKEGSLDTWLGKIKILKEEILSWDFWVALYWLTKPIKDKKTEDEKYHEKRFQEGFRDGDYDDVGRKKVEFWIVNSVADVFQTENVIPMLRAMNNKGDEKEITVMRQVTAYVRDLKSKEKGCSRVFEELSQKISDYTFWGVLYCLYWMKLRPTPWNDKKVWPIHVPKKPNVPATQESPKADSNDADSNVTKHREFVEELKVAYAKNYAPFKSLWIHDGNTLVFYKLRVGRRFVGMEVAVGDKVSVSMYMNNGTLDDIKTYANKNEQLKKLFPETCSQSLIHSNIASADVPAFIDKVLAALRFPNAQVAPSVDPKAGLKTKVSSSDFAKKLQDDYQKRFTPFAKLWIYKANTLVFDEYNVNGKRVAMDVGISPDEVNVTLFMRNGNLDDVLSFVNKNARLKDMFPEIISQRLRHSKIVQSDVPAFIDKVLDALRSPIASGTPKQDSTLVGPTKIANSDFTKDLRNRYLKNFTPFTKLWIYNKTTLVFDLFTIMGKTVAIDVAALSDGTVNVTLFMRNGDLKDVQGFVGMRAPLKKMFPEVVAQRLRRSKIPYADVSAFIDKVLAELRW